MGEPANKLESDQQWATKKVSVSGFTAGMRKSDFERQKEKLSKSAWEPVEFHDGGMSGSYAVFRRSLSYQDQPFRPTKEQLIGGGVVALVLIGVIGLRSGKDESQNLPEPQKVDASAQTVESHQTQPPRELPEWTTQEGTLARLIESKMRGWVDWSGQDAGRVIEITTHKQLAGKFEGKSLVKVSYRANETAFFVRKVVVDEAMYKMRSLAQLQGAEKVSEFMLMPHLPLIDEYGNPTEGQVAKIVLSRSDLLKVNLTNMTTSDFENLVQLKGSLWIHPALAK